MAWSDCICDSVPCVCESPAAQVPHSTEWAVSVCLPGQLSPTVWLQGIRVCAYHHYDVSHSMAAIVVCHTCKAVIWACARVIWALGLIDLGSACAGQLLVLVFRGWTRCPMHLPFSFESQCSAAQIVRLLSYSRWLRCLLGCVCGYHSWVLWQWACTNPARAGVVLCAALTGIFRFLVSVSYPGWSVPVRVQDYCRDFSQC